MENIVAIIFVAILADNFVLNQFLGICPYIGVSKKIDTALGMGMAVIFVMTMAALVTWLVYRFLLQPFSLEYLKTIAFILVIASLVQLVETVLRKVSPALFEALGIYLPLITTNCAILGMSLLSIQNDFSLIQAIVFGASAAIGFTLALVIMAGIRERLQLVTMSKHVQGAAITLVTAGILSIAFMGFKGMMSI